MPIMLTRNRLAAFWCFWVVAGMCRAATPLPDGSALTFALSKGSVRASVSAAPEMHSVVMDASLKTTLAGATDLFVVGQRGFARNGRDYVILAVAKPSTERNGTGYCGAGTEDQLLLLEWQPTTQTLGLRDVLALQSCLKTFELASDQGNDLKSLFSAFTDPTDLKLTWLNHPKYGDEPKSITVRNGKFRIE